jgi:hypothetical protein
LFGGGTGTRGFGFGGGDVGAFGAGFGYGLLVEAELAGFVVVIFREEVEDVLGGGFFFVV